jgi:hypothetical protein
MPSLIPKTKKNKNMDDVHSPWNKKQPVNRSGLNRRDAAADECIIDALLMGDGEDEDDTIGYL